MPDLSAISRRQQIILTLCSNTLDLGFKKSDRPFEIQIGQRNRDE
jgi:hypothetical protein